MCRAHARIRSDFAVDASGELMHVRSQMSVCLPVEQSLRLNKLRSLFYSGYYQIAYDPNIIFMMHSSWKRARTHTHVLSGHTIL